MEAFQAFSGYFYHFKEIDSTQSFIHRHEKTHRPIVCIAEMQTAGYGRRGNNWLSPLGQVYFSLKQSLNLPLQNLQGLTQSIALLLCEYLDPKNQFISIKWPNDLYINNRKLAGILTETQANNGQTEVTIGIGINKINLDGNTDYASLSDKMDITDFSLTKLIMKIFHSLEEWQSSPYLPVNNQWKVYDKFYKKNCYLENHSHAMQLLGIDQHGRLIAKDENQIYFLTQTRILSCIS